jgi:Zn-finger nucleic acid-binding protein
MKCPGCRSNMDTKSINYPVDTTIIKECDNCKGVWLSGVSVSRLIETQRSKIKIEKLVQYSKEHQNLSKYRNCPVCSASPLNIVKVNAVELDFCENCYGVYFDKGELNWAIPNLQKPDSSRNYLIKQSDVGAIVAFDVLLQIISGLFS